ncbi:MAG: hypothetical protein AAGL89_17330 [Pseudomonadota bacterium]
MTLAIIPLLISSGLHFFGAGMVGLDGIGLFLLFPGVLYLLLAVGLRLRLVWVGWVTLICMLGGSAGTAWELIRGSYVPTSILSGILVVDLACAAILMAVLLPRLRSS